MENLRVYPERDLAQVERAAPFTFHFEEEPILAYAGETIGAALMAAGITSLRSTRKHNKPRGIFCGIGICFDCLVIVDGQPDQRACLTPAQPGMVVRIQIGTGGVLDGD